MHRSYLRESFVAGSVKQVIKSLAIIIGTKYIASCELICIFLNLIGSKEEQK